MDPERHARAKQIFLEACDLQAGARAALLARTCGGDSGLREAVEAMLAADACPHALLAAAPGEGVRLLARVLAEDGAVAGSPGAMPARVGRYRLLRELGRGGMGTVFEAEQETPRRRVALKLLRERGASGASVRRFEQEAQLLGRFNHPCIAHVYEAGCETGADGPQPYYAMELVDGLPLMDWARATSPTLQARLELLARLCDALQHAHDHGVLHRDLKPQNVLVSAGGEPKVLDFGVARLLDRESRASSQLTAEGSFLGTLDYMSPEQLGGRSSDLDPRSDVYALGVVGYELVTGHHPYDLRGLSLPRAARVICEQEPIPLVAMDRRLRGDLQTILATAMAKDPGRRYPTAAACAADLRRLLHEEPIEARPASSFYQAVKFARRNPGLMTGLACAALALMLGAGVSMWLARSEQLQRQVAERDTYRASVLSAGFALRSRNFVHASEALQTARPRGRPWEWQRLEAELEPWTWTADVGLDFVWHIAFSDDGSGAVALGMGGGAAILDHLGGAGATLVPGVPGRSRPRALSPDGKLALFDGPDGLEIVDTRSGSVRQRLPAPGSVLLAAPKGAAFSTDGRRLVLGLAHRGAYLYDLANPDVPLELRLGAASAAQVAFSGDGSRVATLADGVAAVWAADTGRLVRAFPPLAPAEAVANYFLGLALDHVGSRLAVGHRTELLLFDVDGTSQEIRVGPLPDEVRAVGFAPSGGRLAGVLEDGSVWVWEALTGREERVFPVGRRTYLASLAWSPDGQRMLTGAHHGSRVWLWDFSSGVDPDELLGHESFVYPVACSPDGTRLASGSWDETVRVWSVDGRNCLAVMRAHSNRVVAVAFSPDGERLFSCSSDGRVVLWNAWTGALLAQRETGIHSNAMSLAPDGQRLALASASGDAGILLLDPSTLLPLESLERDGQKIHGLAFSPDSRILASVGDGGTVRLWDAVERARTAGAARLPHLRSVAFAPDGKRLAVAGMLGTLAVLEVPSLRTLQELRGHPREVFAAAFSRDGERLFSGGRDGGLHVWDLGSGSLVGLFEGHRDYIWSLAVHPDGQRVISGSGDLALRLWDTRPARVAIPLLQGALQLAAEARPRVAGLLAECGDPARVLERLQSDPALTAEGLGAARLELLRQANALSGSGQGATAGTR